MSYYFYNEVKVDLMRAKLHVTINDNWWPDEMHKLIESIDFLYNVQLVLKYIKVKKNESGFPYYVLPINVLKEDDKNINQVVELISHSLMNKYPKVQPELFNVLAKRFKIEYQLDLKLLKYNSPGSLDFLGIGKCLEVITNFFLKLRQDNREKSRYLDGEYLRNIRKRKEYEELKNLVSQNESKRQLDKISLSRAEEELKSLKIRNVQEFLILVNKFDDLPLSKFSLVREKVESSLDLLDELRVFDKLDNIQIVPDDENDY
ncbi:hypothetical protein [Cochleicola gelatinilyticus]|uniref:Uncharacterized protein n=1 Tax=Cochleicola gelatinilyticus TaxID=1763537 RepID=A0A167HNA3_9FLAO|nr:hypothetical protein [Cochleicola gelatinilyticus]OAB78793.1 hypothetical protein ULVI_09430 [Cochleicola gelatinilyticus]